MNTDNVIVDTPVEVKSDLRRFNKAEQQVTLAISTLKNWLTINTDADATLSIEEMKKAKEVEKIIEGKRTEMVKPYNDEVKRINTYAKELTAKINPEVDRVKGLVLDFQKEQERLVKEKRLLERSQSLTSLGMLLDESKQAYHYSDQLFTPIASIQMYDDTQWATWYQQLVSGIEQIRNVQLASKQDELELAEAFSTPEEVEALQAEISQIVENPIVETVPPVMSAPVANVSGLTKRWTFDVQDIAQVPREWLMVDKAKVKQAIKDGTRYIAGISIYQSESITLR
jgi:hypothetical protein